tara:strand:- start:24465 stop:25547 length:1083 start_codon:yes stop_codon:yes gene_type:complete
MAKILFITKKLTANSLNQIEIIRRSGHEFTVLTSQSEKNAGLVHSDILYYFSKWNFIEMARFLPSFMVINPDIVHVFVDSASAVKTADFFAGLAQLFGKLFSVQFFLSEDSFLKMKRAKKLVYAADIVTGPHRTFLYHLRGLQAKNRYQIKGVIPPILRLSEKSSAPEIASDVSAKDFQKYEMLVPLKRNGFNETVVIALAKKFSTLFLIDLESWAAADIKRLNHVLSKENAKPWRFFPMGSSQSDLKHIPKSNFTLWLAGLDFELEECIQFFEFSLNRKLSIVMDQSQVRLYPDLWENNNMASVTQKSQVLPFIAGFSLSRPTENPDDLINTVSLVDISVNEFNRLISKATSTQNEKTI